MVSRPRHRICTLPIASGVPQQSQKTQLANLKESYVKWPAAATDPGHCRLHDESCRMHDARLKQAQTPTMNILVIDDDASLRRTLRMSLEVLGHQAVEARDSAQALELLGHRPFEMALLDLRLAQEQGLDLLPRLLSLAPGLHVVIVTAYATIETAVEAMRRGAFDYLPKPFTPDQLRVVLDRIAQHAAAAIPGGRVGGAGPLGRAGGGPADRTSRRCARPWTWPSRPRPARRRSCCAARAARARASWPGRSMPAARAPPVRSSPSTAPASPPSCWRASCSGTCRARSPARCAIRSGKVAAAEGGTLFLDEIGDLPLALQPKLLRLLQERCYERVGETQTRASNVRILAATNRNLEAEIAAGRFREDLFYRLNVIEVTVPPLRERPGDILPLAEHLLRFFARQNGKPISGFAEPVRDALLRYPWPGNIRELRNAIERGVILAAGPLVELADLPSQIGKPGSRAGARPRRASR